MKIQTLRSFYGAEGNVRKGTVMQVAASRAQALVRLGLAIVVPEQPAAEEKGPRPTVPTGSQTGEGKQSSSSQAAPAPRRRLSISREEGQKSS
ncbi:MAG: hypothetical protein KG075_17540 [Alphaproteobacteria bacterium]|nr:hypothetical protein [Alphaproteobacteria bacterium]